MNKLEPTYLRYVYDGLHKGSLNAENASALPSGFIGLFESEFPADISSVERISVLRRLTLWALFKGAVSTHLASEVLEEDEEDTKTLIDTYSKWFNSPKTGKYILYHDRLRSYFLQKLSSHEVQSLNEKLISYLEAALKDNRVDEAKEYALEHLATHMAVESQLDNNYDRLHDFVNQEDLWKIQVRTSKQYKWSQQAVQYGIKEGARRHHEMNTLTSTVNSVKLMQEEQNSVQQILDLLNEGDYQTALERALSFDVAQLITIYLLMIHELTVGKSKDASYKEIVCKDLLDILKEIDCELSFHASKEISTLIKYKYIVEFLKMGLDAKILLAHYRFNASSILELLENEQIEIHEIIKHNLLEFMQLQFFSYSYNASELTSLFKRYFKQSNSTENSFVDEESGEIFSLRDQMLSLLRQAILNEFTKPHPTLDTSMEDNRLDRLSPIMDIIINYDLVDWIQKEALDLVILSDVKNICQAILWLTSTYSKLLIALGKISEAVTLLDLRAQKAKENNNYVENNNYLYKDMAIYLFRKDQDKAGLYLLEQIKDNAYAIPTMLKAESYLSFAQYLYDKEENDKATEFISMANKNMFQLDDVNKGRQCYATEYICNIDLWISLFEIYSDIGENQKAKEAINQAITLNNKIKISIFKDDQADYSFSSGYEKKYKRMGKICNVLYKRGFLKESKKMFTESITSLDLLKVKIDIEKSLREMQRSFAIDLRLLYIRELSVESEKYPFKGIVSLNESDLLRGFNNISILDYILITATKLTPGPFHKHSQIKKIKSIITSINDNEINILLKKLELNSEKFIKIFGDTDYYSFYNQINIMNKIGVLQFMKKSSKDTLLKRLEFDKLKLSKQIKEHINKELVQEESTTEEVKEVTNLDIQSIDENLEDLSKINILINNLKININSDTHTTEEIREILKLRKNLLEEDRDKIVLTIAPLMIRAGLSISIFYALAEEIHSSETKAQLFLDAALKILNNQGDFKEIEFIEKNTDNEYLNKDKKTEALKMIGLSCRTHLELFREGLHNDGSVKDIITAFQELINQRDIQSVLDITQDYKDLFLIEENSDDWFANKHGKLIPFSYIYYIFQSICKRLLDSGKISEAFTISDYMLENNQIAKVYFYHVNSLLDNGINDSALKYLSKVIRLIDSSSTAEYHIEWPQKGYSYLEIADVYIRMSKNNKAQEYINLALLEIDSADKAGLIEGYIYTGWGDSYKTIINEDNKSTFLFHVIDRLLKISEVDKSIALLKDIQPDVTSVSYQTWDNIYACGHSYRKSLLNISWNVFEYDYAKSLKLIIDDGNLSIFWKRKFYTEFFSKMDFKENILIWKPYFEKDIESFVSSISSNLLNYQAVDSDYIFLSNFQNKAETFGDVLMSRCYNYTKSKTKLDEEKLNLLSQVIDIDELRKISASI